MGRAAGDDRGHGSRHRFDDARALEQRRLTVVVDTNVLVRALTQDDPQQAAIARALLSRDFTLIAGVVLETEWVLRSFYCWPRARIAMALAEIADLPALRGSPAGLGWAIARYAAGADFADMLHIAATPPAERFATFDRRIAADAGPDAPVAIETLA